MDRAEDIIVRGEKIFRQYFSESIIMLQENCEVKKYIEHINSQIALVFLKAKEADKNNILYLGILYLESSLLIKSQELLLLLLNDEFYIDSLPIEHYFQIPVFFDEFENNVEKMLYDLEKCFNHIQPFEIHELRRNCVEYYYASVYKLFHDNLSNLDIPCYLKVFYGKYMGKARVLR